MRKGKKRKPWLFILFAMMVSFLLGVSLVSEAANIWHVEINGTRLYLNDTFGLEINGTTNITGNATYNGAEICTSTNGLCAGSGGGSGFTQLRFGNGSVTSAATNNTLITFNAGSGMTVGLTGTTFTLTSTAVGGAGTNGTGIRDIYVLSNNSLQINLTNGTNITTGNLTGAKGATGSSGSTGPQGPAGADGTNGTNGINGTDGTNATMTSGDNYINITNGEVRANITNFDLRYYLTTNPLGYYNASTIPAYLLSSVAATTYYPLATNPLGYYNISTLPSPLDNYQFRIGISTGNNTAVTNNTLINLTGGTGISLTQVGTSPINITITNTGIITEADPLYVAGNTTILRNGSNANFGVVNVTNNLSITSNFTMVPINSTCFNFSQRVDGAWLSLTFGC
jgi:hypothetical protein